MQRRFSCQRTEKKSYALSKMDQSRWQDGNQVFRKSTSIQEHPARGEEHQVVLQGESDGSQLSDRQADDAEDRNDVWSISGNLIFRHHVQEKVQKFYAPNEGSFPIPLKYIDVVRRTSTPLNVLLESRIVDCRNVDDDSELSGPWTG